MTPERFIATGVVACVSEDDTGIVGANLGVLAMSRQVHYRGRGRQWHLEADSSHKRSLLCVASQVRWAQEAVAWT
jgi:hypothetical protein